MTINLASIPPDGRHRYAIRVYYEDTDAGGVVYHATYLRYAERARTEALRDLGVPHAELVERFGVMFMVRRLEVDYERGARLDEALTVETEVLEVGGASVQIAANRPEQGRCLRGAGGPAGLRAPGRKQARPDSAAVAGEPGGHAGTGGMGLPRRGPTAGWSGWRPGHGRHMKDHGR